MIKQKRSRYFLFSKVNPTSQDFSMLLHSCKSIQAEFFGYHVQSCGSKKYLRGFFVLSQDTTYSSRLLSWFPNFLIQEMPPTMDTHFKFPSTVKVEGNHPFFSIKKDLFSCDVTNLLQDGRT